MEYLAFEVFGTYIDSHWLNVYYSTREPLLFFFCILSPASSVQIISFTLAEKKSRLSSAGLFLMAAPVLIDQGFMGFLKISKFEIIIRYFIC